MVARDHPRHQRRLSRPGGLAILASLLNVARAADRRTPVS
jgi:hypothetical protein